MIYGLKDVTRNFLGLAVARSELRRDEFYAVDDVSFEIKKGECLGIIGSNGSGKSTLLKMLNGIYKPDSGRIQLNGKVGALIEVGAGFHPMLTGRENIFVNGAILGMDRKTIESNLDNIIEFSELEEFIDMPVKFYSNGMHTRLGFSIIAHTKPDVLLIDEILSVGDISFRAKCFNKIKDLIAESGIVFVSHNMADVSRICTSIIVLNKGLCQFQGTDITEGIESYYRHCAMDVKPTISGSGNAFLKSVDIESNGLKDSVITHDQLSDFKLNLSLSVNRNIPRIEIVITIRNHEQQNIIQSNSHFDAISLCNNRETIEVGVNMGRMNLVPGIYTISFSIHRENRGEILAKYDNYRLLHITGRRVGHAQLQVPAFWKLN